MQQIITVIISIAVFAFFVTNHFKKQEINGKALIPFMIFMLVSFERYIHCQFLHSVVTGLFLRILVGFAIGILQGLLAKITIVDHKAFTEGTLLGMAFWLIFIPVRILVLPWFETIGHGGINLNSTQYIGLTALFIFTGFFLGKAITLILRKNAGFTRGEFVS
ncbi:MAG: hypothetical protein E7248_00900 [Paenibacillaceae bacterium]|nr:hypothetical protein [Paenibacillaceae bacterium]